MSKSAIDRFTQDFQDKLNDTVKGRKHEINFPEVGMKVFTREIITANRKGKILAGLKENQLVFCAEVAINCLINENAEYIFSSGDRHSLLRECDSEVLERVSADVCKIVFGDDDVEEALLRTEEESAASKNSKAMKN